MNGTRKGVGIVSILMAVSACAGGERAVPAGAPVDRESNVRAALLYDANKDGDVTREEMETGLARELATADRNGDGALDLMEMQAENQRRFVASQSGFSPLIDWNRDGKVDRTEFSTTIRSLFAELDSNQNGVLSGQELQIPRARPPQPPAPGRFRGR